MLVTYILLFSYLIINSLCDLRIVLPTETLDLNVTVTALDYGMINYANANYIAATNNGLKKIVFDYNASANKLTSNNMTLSGFDANAENEIDRIAIIYYSNQSKLLMRHKGVAYRFTADYSSNTLTKK